MRKNQSYGGGEYTQERRDSPIFCTEVLHGGQKYRTTGGVGKFSIKGDQLEEGH